tara:strand:- start:12017 stop:13054 length:1038 start_codon:yes stop_codon:yes gene_type:complete
MQISTQAEKFDIDYFLETKISVPTQYSSWISLIDNYDGNIELQTLIAHENNTVVGVLSGFYINTDYGIIYNSIPYPGGYGGIISDSEEAYKLILDYLVSQSEEKSCILATICNTPWKADDSLYLKNFKPDYVFENFINFIDLSSDLSFNKKIRWSLRKAENNNLTFTSTPSLEEVNVFYKIWSDLMKNYESPHFNQNMFTNIYDNLVSKGKAKFFLALKDDKIVSGYLLLFSDNVIEYFHSAINPEYRDLQPNTFLIKKGMEWGKKKGMKYWNWQSTRVKNSSIHKFKLGWGSVENKHYYFTKKIGDCSHIYGLDPDIIKKRYPFYYFLPYGAYETPEVTFFKKR